MLKYIIEIIVGIFIMILIFATTSCGDSMPGDVAPTTVVSSQDTVPYLWNNGTGEWSYRYNIFNGTKFEFLSKFTFHEEWIDYTDVSEQQAFVGKWSEDKKTFTSDEGVVFQISRKKLTRIEKSGLKEIYVNP